MTARRAQPRTNPFVSLLAEVQVKVEGRLRAVLEESEARASGRGREVGDMVRAVRSLSERGGKRLRPGLCVVGSLSVDERAELTPAIEAGVSLELLQSYFLIHDDWMDEDEERRGGPTAHIELARRLRSPFLGERAAILAGDHAVALAQAHLATVPTTPKRLTEALVVFAEMQLDAVAGQQLDIVGKTSTPELTYELKTASYTVRGPLLLGACLAGAGRKTRAALERFALPAGVAFQLRDDLIGVFGDPRRTGKPSGADLTAGKNTPLVRHGLRLLAGRERAALVAVVGERNAPARRVERAVRLLEECGARAAVEERIAELATEARGALEAGGLTRRGAALLDGAVEALTRRES